MAILCTKTFTVPNCTYDTGWSWTGTNPDIATILGQQLMLDNTKTWAYPNVTMYINPPWFTYDPLSTYYFDYMFLGGSGIESIIVTGSDNLLTAMSTSFKFILTNSVGLLSLSGPDITGVRIWFRGTEAQDFTTISFPSIDDVASGLHSDIQASQVTANACTPTPTWSITRCPKLANVDMGLWLPPAKSLGLHNCALTEASVNYILSRYAASPTFYNAGCMQLRLDGGTSAAPTGQGLIDKAFLIGKGVGVTTN